MVESSSLIIAIADWVAALNSISFRTSFTTCVLLRWAAGRKLFTRLLTRSCNEVRVPGSGLVVEGWFFMGLDLQKWFVKGLLFIGGSLSQVWIGFSSRIWTDLVFQLWLFKVWIGRHFTELDFLFGTVKVEGPTRLTAGLPMRFDLFSN